MITLLLSLPRRLAVLRLCASVCTVVALPLGAQVTWTGNTSTTFSTGSNWAGDSAPANDGTANLVIPGSSTINVDTPWSVNGITISAGSAQTYFTGTSALTIGTGGVTNNSGQTLNFNINGSTVTLNGAVTFSQTSNLLMFFNTTIAGTGSLIWAGSGTFFHNSGIYTNTYTGSTTISGGTFRTDRDSTLGTAPITPTPGSITLSGGTLSFSISSAMTLSANRGIAVTSASTISASGSGNVTYGGSITGSAGLTKNGSRSLILTGESTYSGTLSLTAGGLTLSHTNALGNATIATSGTGTLTFGSNITSTNVGAISGSRAISLNSGVAMTLITGGNNASTTYSGVLSNTGGLTKTGTGTLTLTAANTYTGATTVNGGTLFVNGSSSGTGAVTVNSGGLLGGTGSLAGAVTVNSGGGLSPGGSSPGTLTLSGGLNLKTGSILNFSLGTSSSLLALTGGTFTGAGTAGGVTVNLTNSGGFAAGTYTLVNYASAGGTSGLSADQFIIGSGIDGYTFSFALNSNRLELIASAVPEPSTYALIGGLAALGFVIVRRRRSAGSATIAP